MIPALDLSLFSRNLKLLFFLLPTPPVAIVASLLQLLSDFLALAQQQKKVDSWTFAAQTAAKESFFFHNKKKERERENDCDIKREIFSIGNRKSPLFSCGGKVNRRGSKKSIKSKK